jgi:hypothetical protein
MDGLALAPASFFLLKILIYCNCNFLTSDGKFIFSFWHISWNLSENMIVSRSILFSTFLFNIPFTSYIKSLEIPNLIFLGSILQILFFKSSNEFP